MDRFGIKGIGSKIKGSPSNREQGKFQFDIKIISVENLPVTGSVFVSWKRGTKSSNNGKTKCVTVNSNKSASFQHPFTMVTTLYKEKPPKKTYESKTIAVSIKEEKNKKSIAKTMIDLADFTQYTKDDAFKSIQIKQKKGGPIIIALNVRAKEMEMSPDDEPATETDLNSNDGSDDEDGEDFEQDDDNSSVSSNHNNNNNNNKYVNKLDDDDILAPVGSGNGTFRKTTNLTNNGNGGSGNFSSTSTTPTKTSTPSTPPSHSTAPTTTVKPFSNDTEAELNALLSKGPSKPVAAAAPVKVAPVATLSTATSYNPGKDRDWKREADDANHRVAQLERQVEVLQKDLKQAAMNGGGSGGSSNAGGVSAQEFADLKKRFREISGDNIDLEDKVKELEEKLANLYKQQATTSTTSGSRQISELQEQVRQKDSTIQDLNTKNRRLERDLQDKDQEIVDQSEQVKYYQAQLKTAQQAAQQAIAASGSSANNAANEEAQEEIAYLKREIQVLKETQSTPAVGGGSLELKRKIQDLTRELKEKDDQLAKLKLGGSPTTAAGSLSSIAAATSSNITITNLEKQNSDLNKSILQQQQEIDRCKQEIQQLQQQLQQSQKKIHSLTSAPIQPVVSTEEIYKRENMELKEKLTQQNSDLKRAQEKYDLLNSRFNDEIEETNNVVNDLRIREETLQRKVDELTQENQQMEHRLSNDMTSAASALSMTAMSSTSKFSSANRDKDRQERENAERQFEQAKSELSREREKTKRLDRELKEYRERVRLLELQVEEGGGSVIKQENQEKEENQIIEQCIYTQSMTFRDGIGATAAAIFEHLSDLNAFTQENARFFNKVHKALSISVEKSMYNSADLAYWLSNISGLIHLIKDGPNNIEDDHDPIIDGVLIMSNGSSSPTYSYNSQQKTTPSQNFYNQLENLLRESYSLLLHNIYNKLRQKLTSIISQGTCILDKKTFSAAENDADINKICKILQKYMNLLKDRFTFDSIVQQFFSQTFHFISYTLLNEVINGENFCTPSSGFKIKLSLSKMDDWVSQSEERELLLPARDHFMSIIEAANLMVIDKSIFTDSDSIISAFETLNILQIKKLLEIWKPDNLSPDPIPKKIITSLNQQLELNSNQRNLVVDPTVLIDVKPKLG